MFVYTPSTRKLAHLVALGTFVGIVACTESDPVSPKGAISHGIVVLDGYVQPGLTLLGDTGTASTRIALGSPTEFDASGISVANDTAVAASSRTAGDLLYIASLVSKTVRKIQLPVRSNPGAARLLAGGNGQALVGVALRDSSRAVLVRVGATTATFTNIDNVGNCPTDVFRYEGATWVVDANANCKVDYASIGDVRLIRVPDNGGKRDTLTLSALRGSQASALVIDGFAYVSAGGEANFNSFPYRVIQSGGIAKIDLHARAVVRIRSMPLDTYGATTALGRDGFLYVSLYQDLNSFNSRIVQFRPDDMSIVNAGPESSWRKLTATNGADVTCGSGVADAQGRIHCLVSGAASATSVVVFDAQGHEVRRVPAGQGGVDLVLW